MPRLATATFKKGQKVIKIFTIGPIETGTVDIIRKVTQSYVQLSREPLKYDVRSGAEIDVAPGFAAAGISSRIILMGE